ncbi:MAG: hypothetical protein ACPGOV_03275 [Magnetovibrionaceae bacterium]
MPAYGAMSHDRMIGIINSYYQGDWERAVWDWIRRAETLDRAHRAGDTVSIRGYGLVGGEALARHLADIRASLDVIHCLRDEIRMAEEMNNMATAAGE